MANAQLITSYENEGFVNRDMTYRDLVNTLTDHCVDHQLIDGKLFASDMASKIENGVSVDVSQWVDTSDWYLFDMLNFLNY